MNCPYCKSPQSTATGHFSNTVCGNNLDIANCPTPAQSRERGYAQAIAEVVSMLKTSRTAGGETITSARHAADVVARGDARVMARLVELEKAEVTRTRHDP